MPIDLAYACDVSLPCSGGETDSVSDTAGPGKDGLDYADGGHLTIRTLFSSGSGWIL